jgi:gluconokinase
MIYLIMGVMGSGKSTVGKLLASRLKCPLHEADDYHSRESIKKMESGISLNDKDRKPWIFAVRAVIDMELANGGNAVITCSALKEKYRKTLISGRKEIKLIYLKATKNYIYERMRKHTGHHINPSLLPSQFNDLEEPKNALTIEAQLPTERIVDIIISETVQK